MKSAANVASTDDPTTTTTNAPDLAALAVWAPQLAKTFVSLASDIALVIDGSGVIRNVAQSGQEPIAPAAYGWVGRAWVDTVSGDTRPKIENLLKEVAATGIARRREVNHPLGADLSIPVAYTAIRLGANGPVLAVGRDLRAIAAIQQRLVESQQEMERGYWKVRQAASRDQVLLQVATDAVFVVDAMGLQIVDANPCAAQLFDVCVEQMRGRHASFAFEHHSRGAVNELLNGARTIGQTAEIRARLLGSNTATQVAATPFRCGDAMQLLVRVRVVDSAASTASPNKPQTAFSGPTRDGVVVTDSSGRVLLTNPAFVALLRAGNEAEVKGQLLLGWLDAPCDPPSALLATVRRHGIARQLGAWLKPSSGPITRVDVSAALLTEGDQECIGFTLHPTPPIGLALHTAGPATVSADNAQAPAALADDLRCGLEQLAGQLGSQTLAEMLRAATALAERHFLQQALQRTGGDVAAAAGLLGVSDDRLAGLQPSSHGHTQRDPVAGNR